MKAAGQLAVIAAMALAAAGVTYGIKGPPQLGFHCDPATLKTGEICLASVPTDSTVLWVDARSRAAWEKNGVAGSVLWNLDQDEDMQAFEAEVATRMMDASQVVVYCGDENCGVSRQVADQIRKLELGPEVFVLKGGWRALHDAGRTKDTNSNRR